MQALENSEKFEFEVHISRMILIARFRTLTPVSLILSATFSKYYKIRILGRVELTVRVKDKRLRRKSFKKTHLQTNIRV